VLTYPPQNNYCSINLGISCKLSLSDICLLYKCQCLPWELLTKPTQQASTNHVLTPNSNALASRLAARNRNVQKKLQASSSADASNTSEYKSFKAWVREHGIIVDDGDRYINRSNIDLYFS
jgi:hypothetical protein